MIGHFFTALFGLSNWWLGIIAFALWVTGWIVASSIAGYFNGRNIDNGNIAPRGHRPDPSGWEFLAGFGFLWPVALVLAIPGGIITGVVLAIIHSFTHTEKQTIESAARKERAAQTVKGY